MEIGKFYENQFLFNSKSSGFKRNEILKLIDNYVTGT